MVLCAFSKEYSQRSPQHDVANVATNPTENGGEVSYVYCSLEKCPNSNEKSARSVISSSRSRGIGSYACESMTLISRHTDSFSGGLNIFGLVFARQGNDD